MASVAMTVVMAYDVSEAKRRRRVAKALEAEMTRVQKSVFEARLTAERTAALSAAAAAHLGPGDSLRVYSVGHDGLRRSEVLGTGAPLQEEADFWLV